MNSVVADKDIICLCGSRGHGGGISRVQIQKLEVPSAVRKYPFRGCSATSTSHTTMSGRHPYRDTSDMSSAEPLVYRHNSAHIQHDPYSSTSDLSDADSMPHSYFNDTRRLMRAKTYDHDSFYQSVCEGFPHSQYLDLDSDTSSCAGPHF
jgi:hypothetical protein